MIGAKRHIMGSKKMVSANDINEDNFVNELIQKVKSSTVSKPSKKIKAEIAEVETLLLEEKSPKKTKKKDVEIETSIIAKPTKKTKKETIANIEMPIEEIISIAKPTKTRTKKETIVSEIENEDEFGEIIPTITNEVTFEDLGIEPMILQALKDKGYIYPTPIQRDVIPLLLTGGIDVIGQAQTGTGKTAAFGLPILQNIEEGLRETQALILTPTRELAIQVASEIDTFKGKKRINIVTVYGGQPIMQQMKDLSKGADIVVGTPGRVIDLMKRGKLDLENVEYFVLDEADEMLNMGFIEDIEWIMNECNENRQMLLFSATMPTKIKKLASKYMGDYELIAVKNKEVTTENTEQIYYPVFPKDRFKVLERILLMEPDFYGIIFTNTKITADDITRMLLKDGIKAEALHGDIAQNQRERILTRFKEKKCTVLVATDVAARGIDVNDLTHVINYGLPQDSEAYIHRIGRTGRAGKKGKAISLISNQDLKQLMVIEGIANTKIRKETLPDADTLITNRKNEIIEAILDQEISEKDSHFQDIADELLQSENVEEVLVKILKDAYRGKLNIAKFETISQPKTLDSNQTDETRLFVALGKNEGYNNEKIQKYFMDNAGVEADAFLDIYVLEEFSFITVPFKEGLLIQEKFKKIKKNGRDIVTRAKAKGGSNGGNFSNGGGSSFKRNDRNDGDRNRGERGGNSRFGGDNKFGDRREKRSNSFSSSDKKERFTTEKKSSNESSSFGNFSNNYGPKKTERSFTSKRRKA